jgi:hypothetical protein
MAFNPEKNKSFVDYNDIKRILSNEETRGEAIALLNEKDDNKFAEGLKKL